MARIFVTGSADGSEERAAATRRRLPAAEHVVVGDVASVAIMHDVAIGQDPLIALCAELRLPPLPSCHIEDSFGFSELRPGRASGHRIFGHTLEVFMDPSVSERVSEMKRYVAVAGTIGSGKSSLVGWARQALRPHALLTSPTTRIPASPTSMPT